MTETEEVSFHLSKNNHDKIPIQIAYDKNNREAYASLEEVLINWAPKKPGKAKAFLSGLVFDIVTGVLPIVAAYHLIPDENLSQLVSIGWGLIGLPLMTRAAVGVGKSVYQEHCQEVINKFSDLRSDKSIVPASDVFSGKGISLPPRSVRSAPIPPMPDPIGGETQLDTRRPPPPPYQGQSTIHPRLGSYQKPPPSSIPGKVGHPPRHKPKSNNASSPASPSIDKPPPPPLAHSTPPPPPPTQKQAGETEAATTAEVNPPTDLTTAVPKPPALPTPPASPSASSSVQGRDDVRQKKTGRLDNLPPPERDRDVDPLSDVEDDDEYDSEYDKLENDVIRKMRMKDNDPELDRARYWDRHRHLKK